MWVVGYIPGKLGSFERFMEVFAARCADRGAQLSFVFRGPPMPEFSASLHKIGARVHVIAMRSRLDWRFALELFELIQREQPDILHSNFDLANFATSLVATVTRVPIYIWHQHNFMGQRFSLLRWIFLKFLNRIVVRVLCVTDSMKSHLTAKGMKAEKVMRLYIGPDLDAFTSPQIDSALSVRREFDFPETSVVLTCVGVALPEKGQQQLVEAFALITSRFPNARLLLVGVGHGSYAEHLRREVDRLGLREKLRLTETRNDVARILHESDISVVSPTEEVSLLAIMESMASSKPVIATRVGGIPEVVTHGQSGLLVPPSDVPALASALSLLLGSPPLRDRLGKASRIAVEEKFNTRAAASRMLDVYEELASSAGG
jgi:glycosyltransferase involved in cell wall biosynthesis